jgi:hypothetical protein
MSTKRRESAKRILDPEGGYFCSCGCGKKPGKGRLYWHSAECVELWREKNDPSYIRQQLKKRDKGICAACGCDSEAEFRSWQAARKEATRLFRWLESREELRMAFSGLREHGNDWHRVSTAAMWPDCLKDGKICYKKIAAKQDAEITRLMGPHRDGWTSGRVSAWDADHILEVVNGGGLCGLENYQTLCHPCHKAKTAKLAADLAVKRRRIKDRLNADLFTINTLP